MNQDKREKSATELLMSCTPESKADFEAVVEALVLGVSLEEILAMPELTRWPDAWQTVRAVLNPHYEVERDIHESMRGWDERDETN
jgi:hypothetical protein